MILQKIMRQKGYIDMTTGISILVVSFLLGFFLGSMPRFWNREKKKRGFHGKAYSGDVKKWDEQMMEEYKAYKDNPYMEEEMDFFANQKFE